MTPSDDPDSNPQAGFRPEVPPPPPEQQTGFQPNLSDLLKKQHAETARTLAKWLVGILAFSIILQYVSVVLLVLLRRDDGLKVLEELFHSWLPVVSGLASAAATYYFTREESKRSRE